MVRLHSAGHWAEKTFTAEHGQDRLGTSTIAYGPVRILVVSQPELKRDLFCWLLTHTSEIERQISTSLAL